MDNLNQIKLQLKHLRDVTEALDTKLNIKPSVEVLNNYYTKSEADSYLSAIQASVSTLSTKLENISGSLVSLIDQIKY